MLILAYMGQRPEQFLQTAEIATATKLAKPTVAKILKQLVASQLLTSTRGATGGYKIIGNIQEISLANIVTAIEGELAITECNSKHVTCKQANHCSLNSPWQEINQIIYNSLAAYKLSDLIAASHSHCQSVGSGS